MYYPGCQVSTYKYIGGYLLGCFCMHIPKYLLEVKKCTSVFPSVYILHTYVVVTS